MKLTVCLVTKGRPEFLDEIKENYRKILMADFVELVIVLNGTNNTTIEEFKKLQIEFSNKVKIIQILKNDFRMSRIFMEIIASDETIEWVLFPGDDDLIELGFIEEWKNLENKERIVAFTSRARVMDKSGRFTGEILESSILKKDSMVERVALSFHEPAFIWPSTIFNIQKVLGEIPSSRYVSDWIVGIKLILAGEVTHTNNFGLSYRNYESQESAISPNRRKFFEAVIWQSKLFDEGYFADWISKLDHNQILLFWKTILKFKPIYNDTLFSYAIINIMFNKLQEITKEPLKNLILNYYALYSGVLLKNNEGLSLLELEKGRSSAPSNINFEYALGVCDIVRINNSDVFDDSPYRIRISCDHSNYSRNNIYVRCKNLIEFDSSVREDIVINQVTNELEFQNQLDLKLSTGEIFIIRLLRTYRSRLPYFFKNFAKNRKIDYLKS